MALLNVIGPGTYGIVPTATIDRNNKSVQFLFQIFTDQTKSEQMFSRHFFLHCLASHRKVTSITKRSPDGTEADGDYFFVPPDVITGDWADLAGNFAQYMVYEQDEFVTDEQGNVSVQKVTKTNVVKIIAEEGLLFTCLADNKTYRIGPNKTLSREIVGSEQDWITYFDFSVSTAPGTNLIAQCYLYLKNSGLYPNATDA